MSRLNDASGHAPDRATSFHGINSLPVQWEEEGGSEHYTVLIYLKMSCRQDPETQHKGVSVVDRVIELFG